LKEDHREAENIYKELMHKTAILIGFFYDTKYKLEKLSVKTLNNNMDPSQSPGNLIKTQFIYWNDYCNFLNNMMSGISPFQFKNNQRNNVNTNNKIIDFINDALSKTYETIKLTIHDIWKLSDISTSFSVKNLQDLNEVFKIPWDEIEDSQNAVRIINRHGKEMINTLQEMINNLDIETQKKLKDIDAFMISKLFPDSLKGTI
jgi:hypothetical protein